MKINPVGSEYQYSRPVAPGEPVPRADIVARPGREKEAQVQQQEQQLTRDSLERAIEELNNTSDFVGKRLQFSIHEESERMQVFVIDNKTQEVIKEIPPEEFLKIVARIQEMVGLLLDERV
jgi:flagellar protein FlaG